MSRKVDCISLGQGLMAKSKPFLSILFVTELIC
uniref:Uncharacterized protein n=1 Tax=Rhizophora mucronata TaxID=61149 RepID=A0A2P2NGW0_RHIMU